MSLESFLIENLICFLIETFKLSILVCIPWICYPSSNNQACALPLRLGFANVVLMVLQLRRGGLLFGGPPCGSLVFINRGTSKRSRQRPLGDCNKGYVRDSNTLLVFYYASCPSHKWNQLLEYDCPMLYTVYYLSFWLSDWHQIDQGWLLAGFYLAF